MQSWLHVGLLYCSLSDLLYTDVLTWVEGPSYVCVQVTALLVLYGLPRLLTGTILAHECMHAWFVLNYIDCSNKTVNEGLSQLMALIWIEAQRDEVSQNSS